MDRKRRIVIESFLEKRACESRWELGRQRKARAAAGGSRGAGYDMFSTLLQAPDGGKERHFRYMERGGS
jgi:hypothetical protein